MYMGLAVAGIRHQSLEVRLIDQDFEQLFPDALITPATKTAVGVFQSPYEGGRSRQGKPVHRIQSTALINRRLSGAMMPH